MSYYRYNDLYGGQPAQDRVRGSKLPLVGPELSTPRRGVHERELDYSHLQGEAVGQCGQGSSECAGV